MSKTAFRADRQISNGAQMSPALAAAVELLFQQFHEQLLEDVQTLMHKTDVAVAAVQQHMMHARERKQFYRTKSLTELNVLHYDSSLNHADDPRYKRATSVEPSSSAFKNRCEIVNLPNEPSLFDALCGDEGVPVADNECCCLQRGDINTKRGLRDVENNADKSCMCMRGDVRVTKSYSSASLLAQKHKQLFFEENNADDEYAENAATAVFAFADDSDSEWSVQSCPAVVCPHSVPDDSDKSNSAIVQPSDYFAHGRRKSVGKRRRPRAVKTENVYLHEQEVVQNFSDAAVAENVRKTDALNDEEQSPAEQIICFRNDRRAHRLRKRLRVMLMDPVSKVKIHHKKTLIRPIVQTLKIILITLQIVLFAQLRFPEQTYLTQLHFTLSDRFLGELFDYNSDPYFSFVRLRDAYQYGEEGIVTKGQYNSLISNALDVYCNMPNDSMWTLDRVMRNATMCRKHFTEIAFDADRHMFVINRTIQRTCLRFNPCTPDFDPLVNLPTLHFASLITLDLRFEFYAFKLNRANLVSLSGLADDADEDNVRCSLSAAQFSEPLLVNVTIHLDNTNHAPRIPVSMRFRVGGLTSALLPKNRVKIAHIERNSVKNKTSRFGNCTDQDAVNARDIPSPGSFQFWLFITNSIVCMLAILSLILCLRSLVRAQSLRQQVQTLFVEHFCSYQMSRDEWWTFINLWLIFHIATDILIISATVTSIEWYPFPLKLFMFNRLNADLYVILFSSAALLCWSNMLRYFTYFPAYNILLRTLKGSMPNVLRYSVCIMIIYTSLAMFAWLVFGPYYPKFRTFMSTFEALFSLINNDDINASFAAIGVGTGSLLWFAHRIFIYLFVLLFSYIVIGLCATIIIDTYDALKTIEREKEDAQADNMKNKKQNNKTFDRIKTTSTNVMSSTATVTDDDDGDEVNESLSNKRSSSGSGDHHHQMWPPKNVLQWFINADDDDVLIINRATEVIPDRPHIASMAECNLSPETDATGVDGFVSPDSPSEISDYDMIQLDDADAIDVAVVEAMYGLSSFASRIRSRIGAFVHRYYRRREIIDEEQHSDCGGTFQRRTSERPPTRMTIVEDGDEAE